MRSSRILHPTIFFLLVVELLTAVDAGAQSAPESDKVAPSLILSNTATLYSKLCADCHGAHGKPDPEVAALFSPPPIAFAARRQSDQTLSESELLEIIRNGKNGMPGFRAQLAEEQIRELGTYLSTLNELAQ